MAKKFSTEQTIGIVLILSALLIYLQIPFINGKMIGTLAVLVVGLWSLFR